MLDAWKGPSSDDFAMTRALERRGKTIVFCAECLARDAASLDGEEPAGIYEPANPDYADLFAEALALGALAHVSYSLTLIYAASC